MAAIMLGILWRQNIYLDSTVLEKPPSLSWVFVGGGIAGPIMGGAGSQSQRAAAVLILGLASKHGHSRLALWIRLLLLLLALLTHWSWHFSYMIVLGCPCYLSFGLFSLAASSHCPFSSSSPSLYSVLFSFFPLLRVKCHFLSSLFISKCTFRFRFRFRLLYLYP